MSSPSAAGGVGCSPVAEMPSPVVLPRARGGKPLRVFSGYDSAWTRGNRGAIASLVEENGRLRLIEPELASFGEAPAVLLRHAPDARLHVVGIDQPLVVKNAAGCRPVERGVAPMISRRRGGMQPAYRGRAEMFGDGAPIWRFLEELRVSLDPLPAAGAAEGRFAFEVYPAAIVAGLFPHVAAGCAPAAGARAGRVAPLPKYNPQRRTFRLEDWRALCVALADLLGGMDVDGAAAWCRASAALLRPRKHDQDRLDAVLCAICSYLWWAHGRTRGIVVGTVADGYIVTPASPALAREIELDCLMASVPFRGLVTETEPGAR